MNKMVLLILLILLFVMSCLTASAFWITKEYVDPNINGLTQAVRASSLPADNQVASYLQKLRQLRIMAGFYVPAAFVMTALVTTLVLAPLIRRAIKRSGGRLKKGTNSPVENVSTRKDESSENAAERLMDIGAFRMLSLLQNRGRLIDFFQEEIAGYPDAQIGAAVRYIHEDCRKALGEYIAFTPVLSEKEGDPVAVPSGFDPAQVRLTGQVTGEPPFKGVLQHSGWKVTRIKLPDQPKGQDPSIIAPAEVEIGSSGGGAT